MFWSSSNDFTHDVGLIYLRNIGHCILVESNLPNLFFLISYASSLSGMWSFVAGLLGVAPRRSWHYWLALSAAAVL